MKAQDKLYEAGGVFRCCIASLEKAELPDWELPVGYTVPCLYSGKNQTDHGMTWTGEVWRAAWIKEKQ